jgi:hypothetical protein
LSNLCILYESQKIFLCFQQRKEFLFISSLLIFWNFLFNVCINGCYVSVFGVNKILYSITCILQLHFNDIDFLYFGSSPIVRQICLFFHCRSIQTHPHLKILLKYQSYNHFSYFYISISRLASLVKLKFNGIIIL